MNNDIIGDVEEIIISRKENPLNKIIKVDSKKGAVWIFLTFECVRQITTYVGEKNTWKYGNTIWCKWQRVDGLKVEIEMELAQGDCWKVKSLKSHLKSCFNEMSTFPTEVKILKIEQQGGKIGDIEENVISWKANPLNEIIKVDAKGGATWIFLTFECVRQITKYVKEENMWVYDKIVWCKWQLTEETPKVEIKMELAQGDCWKVIYLNTNMKQSSFEKDSIFPTEVKIFKIEPQVRKRSS